MKTADLVDAHGDSVRFCNLPFLKFGRKTCFHGPVSTVKCHEDNALLKAELQRPGNGRVMIVDGGGSTRFALLGDQIALILQQNGWSGIVINGSIRDCEEISSMDVGVFCLATTPKKSSKEGAGSVGKPVSFGSATFSPGEYVYCDMDGVLVSQESYQP